MKKKIIDLTGKSDNEGLFQNGLKLKIWISQITCGK